MKASFDSSVMSKLMIGSTHTATSTFLSNNSLLAGIIFFVVSSQKNGDIFKSSTVPTISHCSMNHKQRQWLNKLLRTMWIHIHDLWLARNDDRHGRTSKAKSQANHHQTLRTIRALYLLKDSVLSKDRDIFYNDLDADLLQPPQELHTPG
jgi:hypothetical protein